MSKKNLPFCLPSLVFLITKMAMVAGNKEICTEGLGPCGTDCDARCKAMHSPEENPQGNCDRIGQNVELCDCLYTCVTPSTPPMPPSPPIGLKKCSTGLGVCNASCNNDCCNAKCGSRYEEGEGYCDTNVGISLCQCTYPC